MSYSTFFCSLCYCPKAAPVTSPGLTSYFRHHGCKLSVAPLHRGSSKTSKSQDIPRLGLENSYTFPPFLGSKCHPNGWLCSSCFCFYVISVSLSFLPLHIRFSLSKFFPSFNMMSYLLGNSTPFLGPTVIATITFLCGTLYFLMLLLSFVL